MFTPLARKFLFKCTECEMIISVEFESPEDLEDVQEDKMTLECPCAGKCHVLRN